MASPFSLSFANSQKELNEMSLLNTNRKRFIFRQLRIPTLLFLVFVIWDLHFFFNIDSGRSLGEYMDDIRRMNDYCNYFMIFISVVLGFLVVLPKEDPSKPETLNPIAPFFVSLFAASASILFFPVPYSDDQIDLIRGFWLIHVFLEQATVIFTASGLMGLLVAFTRRHPVEELPAPMRSADVRGPVGERDDTRVQGQETSQEPD